MRLKGFQELTPVDKALDKFFNTLKPKRLDAQLIPVSEALGRTTAEDIVAKRNLPPFRRSAMDGYAVKAKDTSEATQSKPKTLSLVKKRSIKLGEANEVWTGSPMPNGADSVMMLEHTKKKSGRIEVFVPLAPGINVSEKGEDVKEGEVVVESGLKLTPYHLGLLTALGTDKVRVVRKPIVAILATGDELTQPGEGFKLHKIVEVNSIILSSMCLEAGAEALSLGIAKDDESEIEARIREGMAKADIVITTGGTSVGIHDLVPRAFEKIAHNGVVVHGVAMRPGMPTALAVVHGEPGIILSGNPVAAVVGFEVFARPLIQRLLGTRGALRARLKAKLTRRVVGVLGRRVFLRVRVAEQRGEFYAEPVGVKGSGIITTLTNANGYVVIPEDREGLRENELVTVYLLDSMGM
ncbi:MAG: gephyrin-like molybdotransferase Glp [Candidatus Bathyarchaeia archaeon]